MYPADMALTRERQPQAGDTTRIAGFSSRHCSFSRDLRKSVSSRSLRASFNPRARGGARRYMPEMTAIETYKFQSTRPRGARHDEPVAEGRDGEFQSTRPRGARRGMHWIVSSGSTMFQSMRPRGARQLRTTLYRRLR